MICYFDAANIEDVVVFGPLKDPCDLVSQSHDEVTVWFGQKSWNYESIRELNQCFPVMCEGLVLVQHVLTSSKSTLSSWGC